MTLRLACEAFCDVDDVLAAPAACDLPEDIDHDYVQGAIDAASDIVYVLTGGTFSGRCQVERRPVRKNVCYDDVAAGKYVSNWSTLYGQDLIPLPENLISVDMVTIDGVILAADDYGVVQGRFLGRTNKRDWPSCNELWLDNTEVGVFEIQFTFGDPPDWLAIAATVEIAVVLISDDLAGGKGYLRGITSANVQGANVQIDKAAASMAARQLSMTSRLTGVFAPNPHTAGVWVPNFEEEWQLLEVTGPSMS